MADLRAQGLAKIDGDLVLDRTYFKLPEHDPAAFDQEPLRPYNVGPDALLVNFKAVRFVFVPLPARNAVRVRVEPPLLDDRAGQQAASRQRRMRRLARDAGRPVRRSTAQARRRRFPAGIPQACGERDWYVALLDHPSYVHGMFTTYFRERAASSTAA